MTDRLTGNDLLPADPELIPIHTRQYEVRAFRRGADSMLLRGAVRDQKPPGLYLEGDPEPLTFHHMIVELDVAFPSLTITRAEVVFQAYPNEVCPDIIGHYERLVGLSIARGFTHKVRELFGGPRGCTHTTALLQAMAPVAVQCGWSMRIVAAREAGDEPRAPMSSEDRRQAMAFNLNTCHVWDEDGEHVQAMERGEPIGIPLQITQRLAALGRDPAAWQPAGS
jgi:hypothetical protein